MLGLSLWPLVALYGCAVGDEAPKAALPHYLRWEGHPEYILAEEHHHIVPHLVRMEAEGRLRSGAILVHFDSHHDMGLPDTFGDDVHDGPHDALLRDSAINNFLLGLAYKGTVEHVLFVEPPWSVQCRGMHGQTALITVGVDGDGVARVLVDGAIVDGFFDEGQIAKKKEAIHITNKKQMRLTVIAFADVIRVLPPFERDADVDM